MTTALLRITYRSRSNLHPDNIDELDKIFRTSIRNNRVWGVTGCLAHPDGHFVQVIEGPTPKVELLFQRLQVDTRHVDIEVLGQWNPQGRLFSTWAMARPDLRPLVEQPLRLIGQTGSGAQVTALLLNLVADGTTLYPLI